MGWYKKQKERDSLEVVFNCYCPNCKKHRAERIAYGVKGFLGIKCPCGFKRKASFKKIDYPTKQIWDL